MKVIDLLNKIANGEEVPKKIKVLDDIYYYCGEDETGNCYYSEPEGCGGIRLSFNTSQLNNEVEIIEDKKIEKLSKFTATDNGQEIEIAPTNFEIVKKVNEIIEEVNKLKESK